MGAQYGLNHWHEESRWDTKFQNFKGNNVCEKMMVNLMKKKYANLYEIGLSFYSFAFDITHHMANMEVGSWVGSPLFIPSSSTPP